MYRCAVLDVSRRPGRRLIDRRPRPLQAGRQRPSHGHVATRAMAGTIVHSHHASQQLSTAIFDRSKPGKPPPSAHFDRHPQPRRLGPLATRQVSQSLPTGPTERRDSPHHPWPGGRVRLRGAVAVAEVATYFVVRLRAFGSRLDMAVIPRRCGTAPHQGDDPDEDTRRRMAP